MNKLKPCPFCGAEAQFVVSSTINGNRYVGFEFEVGCTSCSVKLPEKFKFCIKLNEAGLISVTKDDRSKAGKWWNERRCNT